jgi:hypothetical protein
MRRHTGDEPADADARLTYVGTELAPQQDVAQLQQERRADDQLQFATAPGAEHVGWGSVGRDQRGDEDARVGNDPQHLAGLGPTPLAEGAKLLVGEVQGGCLVELLGQRGPGLLDDVVPRQEAPQGLLDDRGWLDSRCLGMGHYGGEQVAVDGTRGAWCCSWAPCPASLVNRGLVPVGGEG